MIEHGAKINDDALLPEAAMVGSPEIVRLLLKHGINPNSCGTRGIPPIFEAIISNQMIVLAQLLDAKGIDKNIMILDAHPLFMKLYGHKTVLMCAIEMQRRETITLLLEKGVDVNITDQNGVSALMCAVDKKDLESVSRLLEFKADVNLLDAEGCSVLIRAIQTGDGDIAMRILQEDVDTKVEFNGKTAADYAKEKGMTDIERLIEEKDQSRGIRP